MQNKSFFSFYRPPTNRPPQHALPHPVGRLCRWRPAPPANRSDLHPADTCFARTTPLSGTRLGGRLSMFSLLAIYDSWLCWASLHSQSTSQCAVPSCGAAAPGLFFSILEIPVREAGSVTVRCSKQPRQFGRGIALTTKLKPGLPRSRTSLQSDILLRSAS